MTNAGMFLSESSRRGLNSVYQGTTLQRRGAVHTGLILHRNLLISPVVEAPPPGPATSAPLLPQGRRPASNVINSATIYIGLNWGLI